MIVLVKVSSLLKSSTKMFNSFLSSFTLDICKLSSNLYWWSFSSHSASFLLYASNSSMREANWISFRFYCSCSNLASSSSLSFRCRFIAKFIELLSNILIASLSLPCVLVTVSLSISWEFRFLNCSSYLALSCSKSLSEREGLRVLR